MFKKVTGYFISSKMVYMASSFFDYLFNQIIRNLQPANNNKIDTKKTKGKFGSYRHLRRIFFPCFDESLANLENPPLASRSVFASQTQCAGFVLHGVHIEGRGSERC